ncbi:MAG: ROK family protein [Thermoplasmata archaeon]|nr:ROK family protein [Thermoplasmata archaeon]MCI4359490.1 ROK family protein [Thermoplasmata archaeon]
MPNKPRTRPGSASDRADPPADRARPDSLTIGVDMGGTKIALAVVSADGSVRASHRHATETTDSADQIVAVIASCVKTCLGDSARGAKAIGAGVAGQIRERDGTLLWAPNLPWRNVPLAAKLAKATGLPAMVTNDVRAATVGEWKFGAGRGERDLVCLFIGTGVGGGIVADGHLQNGASSTAGELGHLTIVSDGRSCHCPNSGCLEAYVGGWAIAERARELAKSRPNDSGRLRELAGGIDRITAETVTDAYRGGDPLSQEILEATVEYLAAGLVSIVNSLNPKVLILGGGVIEGLPSLIPATEALVRQRALAAAVAPLRMVRAGLGEDAGVVGAADRARSLLEREAP